MPCVNVGHLRKERVRYALEKAEPSPSVTAPVSDEAKPKSRKKLRLKKTESEKRTDILAKSIAKSVKKTVGSKSSKKAIKLQKPQKSPKPPLKHRVKAPKTAPVAPVISNRRPTRLIKNSLSSLIKTRGRAPRITRADLINAESALGSTIFGPIPAGHRREFFHDTNNIWIWHEAWTDASGRPHELTVRYEVRKNGVYKKVSAGAYFKLEGDELENFRKATHTYLALIKARLYNKNK